MLLSVFVVVIVIVESNGLVKEFGQEWGGSNYLNMLPVGLMAYREWASGANPTIRLSEYQTIEEYLAPR